jgi:hypothetical protein
MAHRYRFVLVLALWGVRYGTPHVNGLVEAAFRLSPALDRVVLMTDRIRAGIDPRVKQSLFPPPYDRPEFYGHGYRAKLAVFSAIPASDNLPCVFLDLDSIIVGDLGRIAEQVMSPDDLLMLPPAGLGFGSIRRMLDRIRSNPKKFATGNSSVLAFHSAAQPNLSELYSYYFVTGQFPPGWQSVVDDALISSFGRGRVRAVPTDCAVMLRREFLSRIPFWALLKSRLPWVRSRRARIAVVTMNGLYVKPEILATLPEGSTLGDGRGRYGRWSEAGFGSLWHPLRAASEAITQASSRNKSD